MPSSVALTGEGAGPTTESPEQGERPHHNKPPFLRESSLREARSAIALGTVPVLTNDKRHPTIKRDGSYGV